MNATHKQIWMEDLSLISFLWSSSNSSIEKKWFVTCDTSNGKLVLFNHHRSDPEFSPASINSCTFKEASCYGRLLWLCRQRMLFLQTWQQWSILGCNLTVLACGNFSTLQPLSHRHKTLRVYLYFITVCITSTQQILTVEDLKCYATSTERKTPSISQLSKVKRKRNIQIAF